ncbi:hypothetical protein G647_09916 [Cladophialophora carrionii CBS 160.54]|uniref:Uncharacterized protein n=1 Tax=Cladophialophora carrionii CBS 160.54 TaxID=1279043 RepID=V9DLL8_9EURO|nr:uncharacterized protein G647_09916 [Cladophialophora carrionii CBS 160.54]ETI27233.1 hypothetical protein G647_09916 [Cladophialophora carrionii CBS 160.54]
MQKYTTREVLEAALSGPSQVSSATTKRVLEWSEQVPSGLRPAGLEMETPTRIPSQDRMSMNAPLGTSTAVALPNLESRNNAPRAESSAAEKDSGDILHEEEQTVPIAPATQAASPPSQSLGKRRVPHASKDEWAESSGDETTVHVPSADTTASEYFQSVAANSSNRNARKKAKTVAAVGGPRYKRLLGLKQASPKPLSMSKTAVDYRERKKIEKSYKEKICAFIDNDILQRVDFEGGITPDGRLYKAILMMMERKEARPKQAVTPFDDGPGSSDDIARLKAENQKLRERIADASRVLGHV